MTIIRKALVGIAIFQGLSTLLGFVTLLGWPHWYAFMLEGTIFAGRFVLAAILLGVIVGGVQWMAVVSHLRRSRWWLLAHLVAGVVMLGWIAGECLVLGSFMWAHALWGGLGAMQVLLVAVHLGALRPRPIP